MTQTHTRKTETLSILSAHQPVYLPWLGLFHRIALSDTFCYFDDVQYLVKSWNNRNKIKSSSGPIWLTVPVLRKGYRTKKIREIKINNDLPWRRKHWNSIFLSYKKTAYFKKYADFFEDLYNKEWVYLTDLNEYLLKYFLHILKIKVNFVKASEMNLQGYKSGLVLDMCKKLNADVYIFGELGKNYADVESFEKENIEIFFQEYKYPAYPQLWGDFVSHLSIIDLLFNVGESRALDIIMQDNIQRGLLEEKTKAKKQAWLTERTITDYREERPETRKIDTGAIVSAHQPVYLPWLGYFHKISLSDAFVMLDSVQFEKNSFTNRNKIRTQRGPIWLTVPIFMKGHTKKVIRDMEIDNGTNWREKHWKSIYLNYKKTPYFYKYSDFFEELYKKEWIKLCDLLEYTTIFFVKELEINTKLYRQSDLQIHSKKQGLILDMCRYFGSNFYLSGALGKNYIDVPGFEKHSIKIIFQDYTHPVYSQWGEGFLSHLSILDLLFNVGAKRSSEIIMANNITKEYLRRVLR